MRRRIEGTILLVLGALLMGTARPTAEAEEPVSGRGSAPGRAHPAVVEVIAADAHGVARGSGTLVYVDESFGYVLTNWHVVHEASQRIEVVFPDGFRSPGTTVKTDDSWDLALIRIWPPQADPIPVAVVVPKPGDGLTIAGYGQQGEFRAARGVCIHYAAPDTQRPFEMIEISVEARQGDSGGPILNDRGELAGVLFGAGDGATTGSHIGRVKTFLDDAFREQQRLALQVAETPKPSYLTEAALPPAFVPGFPVNSEGLPMDRPLVAVPPRTDQRSNPNPPVSHWAGGDEDHHHLGDSSRQTAKTPDASHVASSRRSSGAALLELPSLDSAAADDDVSGAIIQSDTQVAHSQVPSGPGFDLLPAPPLARHASRAAGQLSPLSVEGTTPAYRPRGFSLDRTLVERLWEATKSVLAVIGAITIVFQFAKASLKKQR